MFRFSSDNVSTPSNSGCKFFFCKLGTLKFVYVLATLPFRLNMYCVSIRLAYITVVLKFPIRPETTHMNRACPDSIGEPNSSRDPIRLLSINIWDFVQWYTLLSQFKSIDRQTLLFSKHHNQLYHFYLITLEY